MARFSGAFKPKISLIQFPGSNCDWDCSDTLSRHYEIQTQTVWHTETQLPKTDAIILPGGFSYGDYLRGGSLASLSPVMPSIIEFIKKGGPVIGICNGFQILTETQQLPGVLMKNSVGRFICAHEDVYVPENAMVREKIKSTGDISIPVAHGEGCYFADEDTRKLLQDNGRIVLKYRNNPNGSVDDIAGITSENGRVWGMMPHPERATEKLIGGSDDGLLIWDAFLQSCL